MKYLVTGKDGQLGSAMVSYLEKNTTHSVEAISHQQLDIVDRQAVFSLIEEKKPDFIIHCAAYTAVDQAEEEIEKCMAVNVLGTENLVAAAKKIGAVLVYFSTDYVFDGQKEGWYQETDRPHPLNVYGQSKYLGEEAVRCYSKHYIVRISWVFGVHGKNFIKTMLQLSETKEQISVVADQIGSPTYTKDVAKSVLSLIDSGQFGTYHMTNEGVCSWAELASYVFQLKKINTQVVAIPSTNYKQKATRPLNSKLSKDKLALVVGRLPDWHDAVQDYLLAVEEENGKV